jgi:hypothetical protein
MIRAGSMPVEWTRPILSGAVAALITWLVLGYALRRARTPQPDRVVDYPRSLRIVALGCCGIAAFIGYAALHARPDQRHLAYSLATVLSGGSLWFLAETLVRRLDYDEARIRVRSPWRGLRQIPWPAVLGYRYVEWAQSHVLETRTHGRVWLSEYSSGLAEFFETVRLKCGDRIAAPA